MEKRRILVLMMIVMAAISVLADKYKVLYVNSPDIRIGANNAVIGNVFTDRDKIVWGNDRQAIKVLNLNTNRVIVLAAKALKKKNASSLYEYLTSTKHLSTRGIRRPKAIETWQIDSTLYLLDTLFILRPNTERKIVVAKIINEKGTEITLPTSPNGQFYIVTRSMLLNQKYPSNKYVIKEIDRERNWEYVVYRRLVIEILQSIE